MSMNDKPSENVMRSVDSLTDGMVSRRGFIGAAVASAAVAGLVVSKSKRKF